ncbi:MAG: hypothetical protein Q8O89_03275 [Nanoarchaeota archaeon]|nr:hypothetical protein [Nanoarchaeota archaeon]
MNKIASSIGKYAGIAFMAFQLGSYIENHQIKQKYAVIPKQIIQKYKVDFRELVSDVDSKKIPNRLENIVLYELKDPTGNDQFVIDQQFNKYEHYDMDGIRIEDADNYVQKFGDKKREDIELKQ